jgi:hypothetical protein
MSSFWRIITSVLDDPVRSDRWYATLVVKLAFQMWPFFPIERSLQASIAGLTTTVALADDVAISEPTGLGHVFDFRFGRASVAKIEFGS